eukprot:TRINITY_DN78981_c0_g1_i1.p1 TRINITY_DN78981_c0_g1~~TRINITY_DN78981_c0_g1_i1.p1  ORF type:complete len:879 (-),score=106.28 TRINITY_DN78981_c0_g1_i1:7-2619(-)
MLAGLLLLCSLLPRVRSAFSRGLQAQGLDYTAVYDTKHLEIFGQVARDAAALLSVFQESVTPSQLQRIVESNLLQHAEVYGSCIAFEPDSYPVQNVTGGVPSASGLDESGNSFWTNVSRPWAVPSTSLWPGHAGAYLYAPYAARGAGWRPGMPFAISMDLADGYNYWGLDVEWFHAARTKFIQGELNLTDGFWGAPYFDEGAGNIEMITFSVPFWRERPLQDIEHPDSTIAPFGNPKQRPRYDHRGRAVYFWGVATIDIDVAAITFRCDTGQVVRNGDCIKCGEFEYADSEEQVCMPCAEGFKASRDGATCRLDPIYAVLIGLCCVSVNLGIFLLVFNVKKAYRIASIGLEKDRLIVHTCLNHGLRFLHMKSHVEVRISGSGIPDLDHPPNPLFVMTHMYYDKALELVDGHGNPALSHMPLTLRHWQDACQGHLRLAHVRSFLTHTGYPIRTGHSVLVLLIVAFASAFALALVGHFHTGALSLIGIAIFLAPCFGCAVRFIRRRSGLKVQENSRCKREEAVSLSDLQAALWEGNDDLLEAAKEQLLKSGWNRGDLDNFCASSVVDQSVNAGVSVEYLLSDEFQSLARKRTGADNPSFYDLKDSFFFGENAIGKDIVCPRDGRAGCALVDTLDRKYRHNCTHFLSWTWRYTIGQVRGALESWMEARRTNAMQKSSISLVLRKSDEVFLYMCFFVNNQYRILVPGDASGSDNLEEVFESRLRKIGKMVALLDDWHEPVYLSRIWTIFEQYTATTLDLDIEIIMPEPSQRSLISRIQRGQEGILEVKHYFSKVDSKSAQASDPKDEEKVKRIILEHTGFEAVDGRIKQSLLDWVGRNVQSYMQSLVEEQQEAPALQEMDAVSREVMPSKIATL